jgi:hypothetical protein
MKATCPVAACSLSAGAGPSGGRRRAVPQARHATAVITSRSATRCGEREDIAAAVIDLRGYVGGKELERDVAVERCVAGAIHLTHATFAKQAGDLVVGERLSDQTVAPGRVRTESRGGCQMVSTERRLDAIDQMISGYGRLTVTSRRSGCDQT